MNQIGFVALERFDSKSGLAWNNYIEWSGLHQVTQIVSPGSGLCTCLINELTPQDWEHVLLENFMISYFKDLDYLLQRVQGYSQNEVVGFVRGPDTPFPHRFLDSRFRFVGYDLIDQFCSISALVNCGGFPESFENAELNQFGLISTFERAGAVQLSLKQKNPNEVHADCSIWALWIMDGNVPK